VKLEAWAVGITAGSREVPGRKGLWQDTSISYDDDDDDDDVVDDNNKNNEIRMEKLPKFLSLDGR